MLYKLHDFDLSFIVLPLHHNNHTSLIVLNSLPELINELNKSTKSQYADIGARLEIPSSDLSKYMHWNKSHYTRNCIKRTEHYELILLCWEEGQETPVHCHGGEECWVYIIDGRLEENHFIFENDILEKQSTEQLGPGEKSFMCDDLGHHQLINISSGRSMSLHLYMDPIDKCTVYDDKKGTFNPVDLTYYSFEGDLEVVGA